MQLVETNNELMQKNIAEQIIEIEEEVTLLTNKADGLRRNLLDAMNKSGITTIKLDCGMIVTKAQKSNIKVDAKACRTFLDSAGIYEEFSKIDETKVKKIYPTAEFIKESEPTKYIKITKGVN
jgi:hypothetical protein